MKRKILLLSCISLIGLMGLTGCKYKEDKKEEVEVPVEEDVQEEKKEELAPVAGAKRVKINNHITHQTIEGFGASYSWYSDWLTSNPNDHEVYDLLFSQAKTTIVRFKNTYKYNDVFAPEAELKIYQEASKRAKANGEGIIVLMSSWSPAAYLKENGEIVGGSSIKKDDNGNYMYEEYGQYWLELIQAYEEYGIAIDYISIQNECDFVADYDGCEFGIIETDTLASYSKAYLAVYRAISSLDDPPKMMGPETMTVDATEIAAYMKEVFEEAPESVYGIAHHLYAGGTHETPNSYMFHMMRLKELYPDLSKWQTEFYRGDVMETVWIIHNSLTIEDLNAYLYWDGVWALPGNIIGLETPWTRWSTEGGYMLRDNYYAMRHFTEFIRPGYKRIDVEPTKDIDLLVSAYASEAQDKIALVAINKSDEEKLLQVDFSAFKLEDSKIYLSICQEDYSQEDLYVESGPLEQYQTLILPAQGIATIDLTGTRDEDIKIIDGRDGTPTDELEFSKEIKINKGQVKLGEDGEDIWQDQEAQAIDYVANGDNGASGEFKALWSEDYLYIQVKVTDRSPDTSGKGYRNQDSVEVFLNQDNSKPSSYGLGDQHYIVSRDNQVSLGQGGDKQGFKSWVSGDGNYYQVEMAIPFKDFKPVQGDKIAFDIQINDSHGNGIRNYALKWSSTSLKGEENLENIGSLILQ